MQFRLPLVAVRVVEAGTAPAAALCARLLGDLGAEVIKVEPPSAAGKEEKRLHLDYNKLALTLDASKKPGHEVLLRLIADANVAVLDDSVSMTTVDELRAARRDLIVARAVGDRRIDGVDAGDVVGGTALAGGVLAALLHHRRTGEGALIEVDVLTVTAPRREALIPNELTAKEALEGLVEVAGPVWHFSDTPAHVRLPAPRPGEHNAYVLVDLLGMNRAEVSRLAAEGVVGQIDGGTAGE